jgi:hypothetical protein
MRECQVAFFGVSEQFMKKPPLRVALNFRAWGAGFSWLQAAAAKAALKVTLGHMMALSLSCDGKK